MLREWLKEQWEDIRYAHKSVWVSMLFFILVASYALWYALDYNYSRQLAERDAVISALNIRLGQLQQEMDKIRPPAQKNPKVDDSNSISDFKENVQEKINDINNDANITYQQYKRKANNLKR